MKHEYALTSEAPRLPIQITDAERAEAYKRALVEITNFDIDGKSPYGVASHLQSIAIDALLNVGYEEL